MRAPVDAPSYEEWARITRANVEVVEKAIGAINRGDAESLLGLFSDDIRFWMPGSTPFSGHREGKEEFLEIFARVAERLDKMIVLDVKNLIAAGEWVVTQAEGDATSKDGTPYCNTYCLVWKLENGKITHFTEYNDTQLIMDVLFPAP